MTDSKNITIALLLVTASILGAMLVSSFLAENNVAQASQTSVRQGDYIMTSGQITPSRELVYVLDIAARRLNVYFPDINNERIDLVDRVNLERAFAKSN